MSSPLSVKGKFAIVTGGGSGKPPPPSPNQTRAQPPTLKSIGINFAFTKLLLQRGCSVVIGDLSLRPESEALLSQYPYKEGGGGGGDGPSVLFHRTNVTSWPDLASLFARCVSAFGAVDIIVPGAGVFEPPASGFWAPPQTATNRDTPSADPADASPGSYLSLDVNLTHPIRLSQLGIGYWTKRGRPGTLVHVSSIAGHVVGVAHPLYHASKHGLHAFVRSLGPLRDAVGIRVSAIAPAAVNTPLWTEAPDKKHLASPEQDLELSPDAVAAAMLDLCEDPAHGDGTILELMAHGRRRVVPLYHADPPALAPMPWLAAVSADLLGKLKNEGLDV
ncbi:putative NAD-dependent 15-hydroxyprostaglandin dehydrogenase [Rosellinia necatrix]|uniref:Putative NAD-dependent 15-hydroxyprostaglandin dehydrogenase n=1 Tax=Rosellinia necatrix TaxID=77044 RepID=A0A1W2TTC2_ROSNE|nr:putative NAD-dependent 15-hydroxyprostaglandin dehydrogenase [Rosellinia necatrix]